MIASANFNCNRIIIFTKHLLNEMQEQVNLSAIIRTNGLKKLDFVTFENGEENSKCIDKCQYMF